MAKLLAQPADQQKMLAAARATYERLLKDHGKAAIAPQAMFERAKVLAMQKDVNGATTELRRFATDPNLKKTSIAPMAILHLATLLRGQNRAADAAAALAECRKEHEGALRGDPARAGWVVQIQYHHAVALREAGKLDEARGLFDQVSRLAPNEVEGFDAALRAGQCQKESAQKKIASVLPLRNSSTMACRICVRRSPI
jgi:TolA-binding protein